MMTVKPDLRGLSAEQKDLARDHWAWWRVYNETQTVVNGEKDEVAYNTVVDAAAQMYTRELLMQPETAHRLALARGRYWREVKGDRK
jgi:hypothetical protein